MSAFRWLFRTGPLSLALSSGCLILSGCGGGDRTETGTLAPTLEPEEEEKAMQNSADYYKGNPGEFPP